MKTTLSRQEAAEMFGRDPQTISNWVAKGLLVSEPLGEARRTYITRASADLLMQRLSDVSGCEEAVNRYFDECDTLKRELQEKKEALQKAIEDTEYRKYFYSDMHHYISIFRNAYVILSHEGSPRTMSVVTEFLDGDDLSEIADRHGLTRERTRQLLEKGIRRMNRAEFYSELREDNRRLTEENEALRVQLSTLQGRLQEEYDIRQMKDAGLKTAPIFKLLSTDIRELNLSIRTLNGLYGSLYYTERPTLYDIVQLSRSALHRMRNIGRKGFAEVEDLLESLNLSLGMTYRDIVSIAMEECGEVGEQAERQLDTMDVRGFTEDAIKEHTQSIRL